MGLFKDMLRDDETLVSNEHALDYDFVPKMLPYREAKQQYVAKCIAPLLSGRDGKNLFVYGSPGIGKTAAIKWVLRELDEEEGLGIEHSDEEGELHTVYINCWQKNTTYKVITEICEQIGYRFTQNKKTDELFKVVKNIINKGSAVFVFDEVDKLEDYDFLYSLTEEIFKKSIVLITNYKEWAIHLDERIKSRLTPDTLEFEKYKPVEIEGILKERIKYAFYEGTWENDAFDEVVNKTCELEDVRQGIYLLRETGRCAEDKSSRKIKLTHAVEAIKKLDEFSVKDASDLEEDSRLILEVVKSNSGQKIGQLYKSYREKGGDKTTKTFQRKIEKLAKAKFLSTEKTGGGSQGNTTLVKYLN